METHETNHSSQHGGAIHLPAPTAWPIVLAFGATLILAGVVTSGYVSILGAVLLISGCVGWFRQVLPHEAHEDVPVEAEEITIASTRTHVTRIEISDEHRAHLPVETYPILSGIKGGIAGGIAMIFPAMLYGLVTQHSIWYPVNLLGGAGVAHWTNPTTAEIASFHLSALIIATIIHILGSVLVGLLYGAMLPMFPRHPIVLGGIVAPLLWTGVMHSSLGVINPALDARISWPWFVVSQVAFGLVAGLVVVRQGKIKTGQSMPFVLRMGVEASGMYSDKEDRH
ncbi:hypothetical protein H7849_24060 [Alloacidobacterium dinghuense]|uniref:Uncharacterized protein n=1 Tax=Alloacidobacterium dinghuense TaxID=2763107 RepID=A0A7G8BHM6_9BACT|nr:hypothetical protein [Alloacidobacterium dinghuense]QNI32046.1 hypothetical protein H7849_24060 [Alloacidobacterium dinghuense]